MRFTVVVVIVVSPSRAVRRGLEVGAWAGASSPQPGNAHATTAPMLVLRKPRREIDGIGEPALEVAVFRPSDDLILERFS